MRILIHSTAVSKPEFEPVDHMIARAHDAIRRFAGDRHYEFLQLTQQLELDLAEAESICRPDVQRQICETYIWLAQ